MFCLIFAIDHHHIKCILALPADFHLLGSLARCRKLFCRFDSFSIIVINRILIEFLPISTFLFLSSVRRSAEDRQSFRTFSVFCVADANHSYPVIARVFVILFRSIFVLRSTRLSSQSSSLIVMIVVQSHFVRTRSVFNFIRRQCVFGDYIVHSMFIFKFEPVSFVPNRLNAKE